MEIKLKHLINGSIKPEMIADIVAKHQSKHNIGAHNIFLGQVRADLNNENKSTVKSIVYSAYETMADEELMKIKETSIEKYKLKCVHIYHSLGEVHIGEISLFVMVSSEHRDNCFDSIKFIVDEIKNKVPIWKKETFNNGSYRWVE